ncbi:MAG: response regulator, partial [Verrucomicrobiota bacterium]|nr:response regulator [Verrucomicrobiota bacterium]
KNNRGTMPDRLKILIIEDTETQRLTLQLMLEKNHIDVLPLEGGPKALKYLENEKNPLPDIIISDVMMPLMDGYELCRKVKKISECKDIPFILLTAMSETEDIIKGLVAGADNFISKPYSFDYLIARINSVMRNQRLRKEKKVQNNLIPVLYEEKEFYIKTNGEQILDFTISALDNAVQKTMQLQEKNRELSRAMEKIKTFSGIFPICASCKKILNDAGDWEDVESYVKKHSEAEFSHSICPECRKKLYPELSD